MPALSVTHEAPLELIRQNPTLAVELVRAMTDVPLPAQTAAALGPTDLTDVIPAKYLADSVVVVSDAADGDPVLAIIIEPQGRDDPTKEYSWPAYLANVRRSIRCPRAFLLVICPDPDEAAKCRRVISIGHPGFDLRPVVIDPASTPGMSGTSPYLAVFAACMGAIDLEAEQGCRQVLAAIRDTGASTADRQRLITIILKVASSAARQILEDMMTTIEWKDDFVEGFVERGIQQGIEKGIQQGIEKGMEKAKAEYILRILHTRGLTVTEQQREKVTSCTDSAQLDRWFDRALTAATAAEVFTG
jgi:hypothetical protein